MRRLPPVTFRLNNIDIPVCNDVMFLGIHIDSTLKWNLHIDILCKKINKTYFLLKTLKPYLQEKQMLEIYYATVYSYLGYNILLWGQAKDIERVLITQKRIVRLIFGLNYRASCRPVFKEKKILTIASIYIYKSVLLIRKNLNTMTTVSQTHYHNTRQGEMLHLQHFNNYFYKESPSFAGTTFYNSLPDRIKKINNFNNFKMHLKQFLTDNVFYTIAEYFSFSK